MKKPPAPLVETRKGVEGSQERKSFFFHFQRLIEAIYHGSREVRGDGGEDLRRHLAVGAL